MTFSPEATTASYSRASIERRGRLDPADQLVGLARHGRDDDDHVIAALDLAPDLLGGVRDAVEVGHRGAAEFHHEKRHPAPLSRPSLKSRASYAAGAARARGETAGVRSGIGRALPILEAPRCCDRERVEPAGRPPRRGGRRHIGTAAAHVGAHPAGVVDADGNAFRLQVGGQVAPEVERRGLRGAVDVGCRPAPASASPCATR